MPVDPAHGRRLPSGVRAGRVLAGLYRAMLAAARRQVLAHRAVDLRAFVPELAKELMPLLLHEYHLGRHQVQRQVRARGGLVVRAGTGFGRDRRGRGGLVARHAPHAALRTKAPVPGLSIDFGLYRLEVPAAVSRLVLDLAGSVTDTLRDAVRGELAAGLEAGEPVDRIAGRLGGLFGPRRAYTIAQTEASRAMHAGEAAAAEDLGAAGLEWLASADACKLCLKLNGKRVKFGQPFFTHAGGAAAYRQVMHPPAHPHCYCSTAVWFPEDERGVARG